MLLLLLLMLETIIVFITNCICIYENLLFFIHIYNAQDIISFSHISSSSNAARRYDDGCHVSRALLFVACSSVAQDADATTACSSAVSHISRFNFSYCFHLPFASMYNNNWHVWKLKYTEILGHLCSQLHYQGQNQRSCCWCGHTTECEGSHSTVTWRYFSGNWTPTHPLITLITLNITPS